MLAMCILKEPNLDVIFGIAGDAYIVQLHQHPANFNFYLLIINEPRLLPQQLAYVKQSFDCTCVPEMQ